MTVEQRIRRCILLERMREQKEYSRRLGLENKSRFHGKYLDEEMKKI